MTFDEMIATVEAAGIMVDRALAIYYTTDAGGLHNHGDAVCSAAEDWKAARVALGLPYEENGATHRPTARRRKPVCPRCLDIKPGTPGGTPDHPHPGPFTAEACTPCEAANEAALRAEGR